MYCENLIWFVISIGFLVFVAGLEKAIFKLTFAKPTSSSCDRLRSDDGKVREWRRVDECKTGREGKTRGHQGAGDEWREKV